MRKTLIIFLFVYSVAELKSQTPSLCREVVASAGDYSVSANGLSLSWTLGETIVETVVNNLINVTLTQGFQQPDDCVTAVLEIISDNVSVKVYPNPVAQMVTLDFKYNETAPLKIELVDMLGRVMNSEVINTISEQSVSHKYDVTALASGMYMFRLMNNNQTLGSYKFQKINY